ncbi:hypothetical protein CASFOL_005137 [Castilleja foliolosa]|uniref:F-box domain-containing protein n=1 Tax=Castilleja foliolosa TaxID=1961234 RepID=A0ABD3E3N5_9LAMI
MRLKMVSMPYLPEEILFNIFSRLPAKSVGKCRCLSKQWLDLLSTKQFIKSHLARANQENLILTTTKYTIRSVDTIKGYDRGTVSRDLKLLAVPGHWVEVLGSCDGLLLLKSNAGKLFMVNPITLEQAKIPKSPLAFNYHEGETIYGFGYDRVRDDYNVVTARFYYKLNEMDVLETLIDMYVYSAKRGFWEKIKNLSYDCMYPVFPCRAGAYVNEAYHWLGARRRDLDCNVIMVFDFAKEVFSEISPPSGVDIKDQLSFTLGVLGGCLCVIGDVNNSQGMDVWIMKEYGVADSWFKLSVDGYHLGDLFKPLCFVEEGEVVLVVKGPRLVVYNVKERTSRDLLVDGIPGKFVDGCTFIESLVLPPVTLCCHREEPASDKDKSENCWVTYPFGYVSGSAADFTDTYAYFMKTGFFGKAHYSYGNHMSWL